MKKNTHTYFYTSFAAYIFGLGLTIFIMHIFKHAQVSVTVLGVQGMLSLQVTRTPVSHVQATQWYRAAVSVILLGFHP